MEERPWRTGSWWVSPYNFAGKPKPPVRVILHDTTLRDGEQAPGVVFRKDEKVALARALDEFGVDRIEAGMPATSREDLEAVKAIVKLNTKASVFVFCRATREDIDLAADCGVSGVVIEVPSGLPRLRYQFSWSEEEVIERSCQAIIRAREKGMYVVFFPYDTTRADQAFLVRLLRDVEKNAKPDSVAVVDTTGSTLPCAVRYLVRLVKHTITCPVEIHAHNDFGLATANSLAALEAGADVIHVCLNGLGERCGNAALEQIAVCLKVFYGIGHYDYARLAGLSEMAARFSGIPVPASQPITGEFAFTREIGLGMEVLEKEPKVIYPVLPDVVGRNINVVMGKKSGKSSVRYKLKARGITLPEENVQAIVELVKAAGIEKKRYLTDAEFDELVKPFVE